MLISGNVLKRFLLGDLTIAVLYVLTRPLAWAERLSFVHGLFDLDGEANLTAWYASLKWGVAAIVVGSTLLVRVDRPARSERFARWALTLLFLALSCDEVAQVHEWTGRLLDRFVIHRVETMLPRTHFWMIVPAIGLALATWRISLVVRHRSLASARYLAYGIGLLIAGGGGMEVLANFTDPGSIAEMLEVLVEETLENIGATLCVVAMLQYAQASGVRLLAVADLNSAPHQRS